MAIVIVYQAEFGIIVLAAPLDGLPSVTAFRYATVRGVGVACADVTVRAVEFTDVLGQVPAVGKPGAVFLDGERAGGDRL